MENQGLYGVPEHVVINSIHEIRGFKVMFDFDLAGIYQIETRALKQAVKRNIKRFPELMQSFA